MHRPQRALLAAALIPLALLVQYVWVRWIPVPWLDDWRLMYEVMNATGDLTAFYEGHHVLVPYAITALLGWRMWPDILLNMSLLVAGWLALSAAFFREARTLYAAVLFAFLVLSIGQRENLIWGHQQVVIIPVACGYVTALLLTWRVNALRLLGMVLLALLASWSLASGMLLWALVPAALWLNGERRVWPFALWMAAALLNAALWLPGYFSLPGTLENAPSGPFRALWGTLAVLGTPFAPFLGRIAYPLELLSPRQVAFSALFGGLGLSLLLLNLRRCGPWLLLVGYGLAAGALIAFGRGANTSNLLFGRYVTLVTPFWVGLVALMWLTTARAVRGETGGFGSLVAYVNVLAAMLLIVGYLYNTGNAREFPNNRALQTACVATQLSLDAACRERYLLEDIGQIPDLSDKIAVAAANDLSIFRDDAALAALYTDLLRDGPLRMYVKPGYTLHASVTADAPGTFRVFAGDTVLGEVSYDGGDPVPLAVPLPPGGFIDLRWSPAAEWLDMQIVVE